MNNPADRFIRERMEEYLAGNAAARMVAEALRQCGVGLMPLVDHCAIRTHDVAERARAVEIFGYQYDAATGALEYDDWWARVYRKAGYPALFIDQAFAGPRGKGSVIPEWVDAHGDRGFHHIAVLVEDIDAAMDRLRSQGIRFAGSVVGEPGTDLRQVFTEPEMKNGKTFTVLELIERRNGYTGFLPPQADGLMESTRG
jgi:catechol 2,3-dioxygenase-like lactoylglutathione lyase family enzyme